MDTATETTTRYYVGGHGLYKATDGALVTDVAYARVYFTRERAEQDAADANLNRPAGREFTVIPDPNRREVEVDTELARLTGIVYAAQDRRAMALDYLHRLANDKQRHIGRTRVWILTDAAAESDVREALDAGTLTGYRVESARQTLAKVEAADDEITAARAAMAPLDAEHAERRWSRFFLVPGGHIHRSRGCSTLRPTTRVGWLPLMSGLTEADAVAEHGPLLCTVCFPSAPVEWTIGHQADYCPGSNKYIDHTERRQRGRTSYATCPGCGETQVHTMSGIRKHKKK